MLLSAALAACGGPGDDADTAEARGPGEAPGPPEHRALWEEGRAFPAFLASVEARAETWHGNWERASVSGPLLDRARAAAGRVSGARFLVVAEDWCGDSAHTMPYLARLVEAVEGLELRVVDSRAGRAVMDAHPTPDERSATPTVLLLDGGYAERGCFVERPPPLQRWFLENPAGLSRAALLGEKYARYEADDGRATVEEMVAVLEAAAAGEVRCPGPAGAVSPPAPTP